MRYGSIMTTITLKNVPPAIHRALQTRARAHGRSLNKEALATLERSLHSCRINAADIAAKARTIRETMGVYLVEDELAMLKDAGRR